MKRFIPMVFPLILLSCREESPRPKKPEESQSAASTQQLEVPPPAPPKKISRTFITAAEFHSQLATLNLSPSQPVAPPQDRPASKPKSAAPEQMQFTRVAGGDDRYCGALSAGPIKCWGRDPVLVSGTFTDVALGSSGYCGISLEGAIVCEKLTPPKGRFQSIVASDENYCALSAEGVVSCFGSQATPPQVNQRAVFIAAASGFACAADPTRRLLCWGKEAPLLPIDSVRAKDLATGQKFVCFLEDDGSPHCLFPGPRPFDKRYSALFAGYETVCGVTIEGAGHCWGRVEANTSGPIRSFAVAKDSVCAHRQDGRLECFGKDTHGQLAVPTEERRKSTAEPAEDASAVPQTDRELWLRFIELFPEEQLPQTFELTTKISLGDRLPPEFSSVISGDPNRFRVGVGFALAHHTLGVTLFDIEERALYLYLYRDRRLIEKLRILDWSGPKAEASVEKKVGHSASSKARSTVALVTSPSTIEVTSYEGTLLERLGAKETPHVEILGCEVKKSSRVIELAPIGTRQNEPRTKLLKFGAGDDSCRRQIPFGPG